MENYSNNNIIDNSNIDNNQNSYLVNIFPTRIVKQISLINTRTLIIKTLVETMSFIKIWLMLIITITFVKIIPSIKTTKTTPPFQWVLSIMMVLSLAQVALSITITIDLSSRFQLIPLLWISIIRITLLITITSSINMIVSI